jgi:hypothetical protein
MKDLSIPKSKTLKRRVQIFVECDEDTAFSLISSSTELPKWLKKSGKISGAKSVEILGSSYDKIGDARRITFEDGTTAVEQLLSYNPVANYSYRINEFSGAIKKLTDTAYGQCWFDTIKGETRITWDYTFTYKSILSRMVLSLILTFSYKKFMRKSLENAKVLLEAKDE